MTKIEAFVNEQLKTEVPQFNVGDTVKVSVKVIEGAKEEAAPELTFEDAVAAPYFSASAITRLIISEVMKHLAASCTATKSVLPCTAENPSLADAARVAPPNVISVTLSKASASPFAKSFSPLFMLHSLLSQRYNPRSSGTMG